MSEEILKSKTILKKGRFTITEYHTLNDTYYIIHFFKSWFFPIGFPLSEKKYHNYKNANDDLLKAYNIYKKGDNNEKK